MATDQMMTVEEARLRLGVSPTKIAQLIKEHVLTTEPNPLDKRSKLVRTAEVEAIVRKAPQRSRKKATRATAAAS